MAIPSTDTSKIYRQKSALIIDDFPDMCKSIRTMLQHFGVNNITTATNGEDAITLCEKNRFDIILADYNLGDAKNGQQVLEELRVKNLLSHTTIYMMITAETTKEMVFGALECQPDDYLAKPFTQAVLQKRLDRMVIEKQIFHSINTARDNKDYPQAIALCQQQIDLNDKYRQRCYRIQAACLFVTQQYSQAKAIYAQILEQREIEWATIGMAKCLMALGELSEAEAIFSQLIQQGCLCIEVFDDLAEIKTLQHDLQAAQRTLEQAIKISPKGILRQEKLADLCEITEDWQQAKTCRKAVIRLSKNSVYKHPDQYLKLARCLNFEIQHSDNITEQQVIDAIEVLQQARDQFKTHHNLELQSDIIETGINANAGERIPAPEINALQHRIMSSTTTSAQLLLDMAQTYTAANEHDKAQALLKKLMTSYEDDPQISAAIDRHTNEPLSKLGKQSLKDLNEQGKQLFANKDFDKAVQFYTNARCHHPSNTGLNLNLLLALVSDANENGVSQNHLDQCQRIKQQLSYIKPGNQHFERYQTLINHIQRLSNNV
jgi:CheY-like chemotaxis protein